VSLADNYTGESGSVILLGRAASGAQGTPAWMAGRALNEWFAIANTAGADGANIDPWCGFCVVPATSELIIPLAGGHGDGWDTRVSSIVLTDDAPAWKSPRRKESITIDLANPDQPYAKDGVTPTSRHTRYTVQYCQQNNRVMLMGSPSLNGGGVSSVESNGFDLSTNTWDPPGTWPSMANNSNQGTEIDDLGNIWCRGQKWLRASNTLVTMPDSNTNYRIACFDTVRRQLFTLSRADGQGAGGVAAALIAKTISENLATVRNITLNPGAVLDEFQTLLLDYAAMVYDAPRDRFLYYWGKAGAQGVVYVVTPNSGTAWDISKLAQGAGSQLPPLPPDAGINARFKYVPALDGVVLIPNQSSNIHFMRLG
jgi:hypothetical protein